MTLLERIRAAILSVPVRVTRDGCAYRDRAKVSAAISKAVSERGARP